MTVVDTPPTQGQPGRDEPPLLRGATRYRLPRRQVHELMGWNVWLAHAGQADVELVNAGTHVEVVLAETGPARGGDGASTTSRTRMVLGADGRCSVTHVASPSVLHVPHGDGRGVAVTPGDGVCSTLETGFGDVLVATTAGFLQAAPAELLTLIPQRTGRRRSLSRLAEDLVQRVRRTPFGERAGVVVAQRVWPSGG